MKSKILFNELRLFVLCLFISSLIINNNYAQNATHLRINPIPDTIGVNMPFGVNVDALDSLNQVVQLYNNSVTLEKIEGPGNLSGITTINFVNGIAMFMNINVDSAGTYRFRAISGSLIPDTSQYVVADTSFHPGPFLNQAHSLIFQNTPDTVISNTDFLLHMQTLDSLGNPITTYNGQCNITKISGPGTLQGNTTHNINNGVVDFPNIRLSAAGNYQLQATSGNLIADTAYIYVKSGSQAGNATKLIVEMANDTVEVNQMFNITVKAVDDNNMTDNTYMSTCLISQTSGAGTLNGPSALVFASGIAVFTGMTVNTQGTYNILAHSGLLTDGNIVIYAKPPVSAATKLKFGWTADTIGVNLPFNLFVTAVNDSGIVDNNYSSLVTLEKISGPGNVTGSLSYNLSGGHVAIDNLQVNIGGNYRFKISDGILLSDTTKVMYADSSVVPVNPHDCYKSTVGKRKNLGLYGGSASDLTYAYSNKRVFACIETPASLFYSDDTCKTWFAAFPDDSLEMDCGKGWGGGGLRVLTNNAGWVACQTRQQGGTMTSSAVSFAQGDTGTWKTAMDAGMMNTLGFYALKVSAISLSDYYMYIALDNWITRINDTSVLGVDNVIGNILDIPGIYPPAVITSIATANTTSGYPVYVAFNTSGSDFNGSKGELYKYNGTSFTKITTPPNYGVARVFTHPKQTTGDTIFISCKDSLTNNVGIFRSFDGGNNWTNIYPSNIGSIFDVDYSPNWVSSMPQSNGLRISIPGKAVSDNLGNSWTSFTMTEYGCASHPDNSNIVLGSDLKGIVKSTTGPGGIYSPTKNFGLEAIKINQIAHSHDKSIFYIATNIGLAYTKAYTDTTISNYDKWNPPYGQFPVTGIISNGAVTSVAINPYDSLHVIAGSSNGFALTTTGYSGFTNITPLSWNTSFQKDPWVNDIDFITSDIIIAVTGTADKDASLSFVSGNIWRSADGGNTWSIVTPSNFSQGNCIAVAKTSADTVIYAGTGAFGGGGSTQGSIWKSTDLGLTWLKVNDGPNSINGMIQKLPVWDIAVDPRSKDTIYVAAGLNLDRAFVRSVNGGTTYQYIYTDGEGAYKSIAINLVYPDTVYTSIRREIYVYDWLNDSVQLFFRGLPGEMVPDLAYGSVLAGTTTGFYKLTKDSLIITGNNQTINNNNNEDVIIYPNPSSGNTNIQVYSDKTDCATILLYDITGRKAGSVINKKNFMGTLSVNIDTKALPSGVYFIRIVLNTKTINKKFIVE